MEKRYYSEQEIRSALAKEIQTHRHIEKAIIQMGLSNTTPKEKRETRAIIEALLDFGNSLGIR